MKWFANRKISTKLLLGFALVCLLTATVGGVGVYNIGLMDENGSIMYDNMAVPLGQLTRIATSFQRIRVNLRDIILLNDPSRFAEW